MIDIDRLIEGEKIYGKMAIRAKETPREYKNKDGMYFFLRVGNKTGSVDLKYWGGSDAGATQELFRSLEIGDVLDIEAIVEFDRFREALGLTVNEGVNKVRKCKVDEYSPEEFLPVGPKNPDKLMEELLGYLESVEDGEVKKLLESFFKDPEFQQDFIKSPAAMTHHHNYVGGLLEHTVGVIRLANLICDYYPELRRDLALAGAMLHDIGKVQSYKYRTAIEPSSRGKFLGHTFIGADMVAGRIKELGMDPDLAVELEHLVLSHHARDEDGMPDRLKTAEAAALHYADLMDAFVKDFIQAQEAGRAMGEEWVYDRTLGQEIYLPKKGEE